MALTVQMDPPVHSDLIPCSLLHSGLMARLGRTAPIQSTPRPMAPMDHWVLIR